MLGSGAAFATGALACFASPSIVDVLAKDLRGRLLASLALVKGGQHVGVVRILLASEDA